MSRQGIRIAASARGPTSAKAFTLIEILVVVAIIALLISILLPSLSRARAQAKILKCRANLHDVGNGMAMYAEQFKRYFPCGPHQFFDDFQSMWDARLLKNVEILVCPATQNVVRASTVRHAKTAADYLISEYPKEQAANMKFPFIAQSDISNHAGSALDSSGKHSYEYISAYSPFKGSGIQRRRSDTNIISPTEMLLVYDEDDQQSKQPGGGNLGCSNSLGQFETPLSEPGNNCPQTWDNHGAEGMNMVFEDAHAQFTKKVAGLYKDYTQTPPVSRQDENASIDKIMAKANNPYLFTK